MGQGPDISQRILAKQLGISFASINFCFRALMEKSWIKMHNFSQSKHKLRYAYLLTPAVIAEKSKLITDVLKRKTIEYEAFKLEIEHLKTDVDND